MPHSEPSTRAPNNATEYQWSFVSVVSFATIVIGSCQPT
jgi:hypothetical protein